MIKEFAVKLLESLIWREFPKYTPSERGWYECTVEVSGQQRYVMNLFWYPGKKEWRDNVRQDVFNSYKVYGYNDETHKEDKRLYTIDLCDRTDDVKAFRKLHKTYMKGFVKEY